MAKSPSRDLIVRDLEDELGASHFGSYSHWSSVGSSLADSNSITGYGKPTVFFMRLLGPSGTRRRRTENARP